MICTEVDGVKRVLFKIVFPAGLLAAWMMTCYPVCNKADGFDVFLYWILVGCPYGLRKMCMILVTVLSEIFKGIRNCFLTRCPKVHEMTDNKKGIVNRV